jgi:hypothetical protein
MGLTKKTAKCKHRDSWLNEMFLLWQSHSPKGMNQETSTKNKMSGNADKAKESTIVGATEQEN